MLRWSGVLVLGSLIACSSDDGEKKTRSGMAGAGGDGDLGGGASVGGTRSYAGEIPANGGEAGSGPGPAATEGWLSGDRLRAVLDVAGGAQLFATWHDTELDIDCDFSVDTQGVERCLPLPYGGIAYVDQDCTQPIAIFFSSDFVAPYVTAPGYEFECGKGPGFVEVGPATDADQLYSGVEGDCQPIGMLGSQIARELGAPVDDETFVAVTQRVQEPRDARLVANVRVASDGSRQVTSHFDLEREAECNPREHQGADYACVPEARAYVQGYYADDACEVPVAYQPGYAQQVCGREPTIVEETRPYFSDEYFEVGTEVTGATYRESGFDCMLWETSPQLFASYYSVGQAVEWSEFPPLVSSNEGSGRILLHALRGLDDTLISHEGFFDTELETRCFPNLAADQRVRCKPASRYTSNEFADDACSDALLSITPSEEAPALGTYFQAQAAVAGQPVFQITGKIATPGQVWHFNGDTCEEAGVPAGRDFYASSPVAASSMVLVTRKFD